MTVRIAELTIMFSDIAGSTQLYDTLGDEKARALVATCFTKMMVPIQKNDGKIIKTIGDEVLSIFTNPNKGVRAAIELQEMMSSDHPMVTHHLQLRIGLHHGPTIIDQGDVFGDAVNVASRMVDQSKADQIVTTAETLGMMRPEFRSMARLVDQTRIKGKLKIFDIYELSWGHPEEQTIVGTCISDCLGPHPENLESLQLSYLTRSWVVDTNSPFVTLGRDSANTIVISDPKVSRLHAHIELRHEKFFIADKSTNGTYVYTEEGSATLLRRDEILLPDNGGISLGQKLGIDSPQMILFKHRNSV